MQRVIFTLAFAKAEDDDGLKRPVHDHLDNAEAIRRTCRPGLEGYLYPGLGGYQYPGLGGYQYPGLEGYLYPGLGGYQYPGLEGYLYPGLGGYQYPGLGGYQYPWLGGYQYPGLEGYQYPGLRRGYGYEGVNIRGRILISVVLRIRGLVKYLG